MRRLVYWLSVFVALALLAGCTGGDPPLAVVVVEYEAGSAHVAQVPAGGRVDILSSELGVRYELTVEGEGDASVEGVELSYRENPRGRSELVLNDPRRRFAPLFLTGTPGELADILGGEVVPATVAGTVEQSSRVKEIVIGTLSLLAIEKLFSNYGRSYQVVEAYFEAGEDLCTEPDVYCTCSTISEIVALQAAANKMDAFAGDFFFAFVFKAIGDAVGGLMQYVGLGLDVAKLTGLDDAVARQIIEEADLGGDFEGLRADEPVLVRLMAFEDAEGERFYSWRGVQVMQRGCDLGSPGVSMTVDLDPMPPKRGNDLRFDVALHGADVGDVPVALAVRAVGSSTGFERMLVASTNAAGRVSFELPPFYHSLTAEYAVVVPRHDLVVTGSFEWDYEASAGRPRPTLWYFRPSSTRFEAPQWVDFRYLVSQEHEEPAARTDLTCTFDPGDGSASEDVRCLVGRAGHLERLRVAHEYTVPGTYEATFTVENRDGARDQLSVPIRVLDAENSAPEILSFSVTPEAPEVGQLVRFDWSVWDEDHDLVSCVLRFGDGSDPVTVDPCGLNESREHEYREASDTFGYMAELTAMDRRGGYAQAQRVFVEVTEGVDVSVSPSNVTVPVNATQSFTATVTGASDTSVTWAATCGSISGSGNTRTYTAPGTAGECEVTATSVADPTAWATATVIVTDPGLLPGALFDDFNDRDYTVNPTWTHFIAGNKDLNPARNFVDVSDQYARWVSSNHGGRGGSVGLEIDVDIPVDDDTDLQFDVLATFRDVGAGCGWSCREYPANVALHLEDAAGGTFQVIYAVNYGGALEDQVHADRRFITTPVTQGVWERGLRFNVRDGWPSAARVTMVRAYGSGWNFDGGIDNIALPAR